MEHMMTFRPATAADLPAIEALLEAAALPLEGARDHLDDFLVGEVDGVVGCVGGYERYDRLALLRSMAVTGHWRGRGIGNRLLDAIKARARGNGIDRLYLLTTTAAGFFGQRGFVIVERNTAPAALKASREFQGICPASATMMVAALTM
ncbi:arsenic resistance N-acetyltransferase ArsN2 [Massilia sp. METH4]|uniref:arsenic resistance N-acetyltransferase ArsN2 n=1 Tax=Massilia sp. METH4 TaxID=3123041 RepID=UPI0030CBB64E